MNRKITAVYGILVLTLIFMAGAIPVGAVCGDVNGNGNINIQDIGYLIQYIYKAGPPPPNPQDADIDGSGTFNIVDVTRLLNFLYRGGPQPTCAPPPFDFPNKPGSWWKYIRYNYLNGELDSFLVTANESGDFVYGFDSGTETQNIRIVGNQVYAGPISIWDWCMDVRYTFPLAVGAEWGNGGMCPDYSIDMNSEFNVSRQEAAIVPAGAFPESYFISSTWAVAESEPTGFRNEWFVPGIGTVKLELKSLLVPPDTWSCNQIWFLTGYYIAP
jgi:hypothetical protein